MTDFTNCKSILDLNDIYLNHKYQEILLSIIIININNLLFSLTYIIINIKNNTN